MKFSLLVLLVSAAPAFASLSPYYDSVRQFEVLTSNSDAIDIGQAIQKIEVDGPLLYKISGESCNVHVQLKAKVPSGGMVGATTYTIKQVYKVECD